MPANNEYQECLLSDMNFSELVRVALDRNVHKQDLQK